MFWFMQEMVIVFIVFSPEQPIAMFSFNQLPLCKLSRLGMNKRKAYSFVNYLMYVLIHTSVKFYSPLV